MPNSNTPVNKNGHSPKVRAPRNRIANKAFYENYGRLLAMEKIWEVKKAYFGRISAQDRESTAIQLPNKKGYTSHKRKDICKRAVNAYEQNELVRAAINLIAAAIFSKGSPDIRGTKKEYVELAKKLIEKNELNFHDMGREAELCGDAFLWFRGKKEETEIKMLNAESIDSVLDNYDITKLSGYKLEGRDKSLISPARIQHLKINSTATSQYGRSSVRHLFYFLDVLDSLFEKNWLRGAEYYGNPLIAITGVPGPYQSEVKTQIEAEIHRAGKSWVLPPDTKVESPDLSLDYPIGDIVGWVFRMISIATEIPITLLGTADAASRGSAFFASPRFALAIQPRREVWRIGLRNLFLKIFRASGMLRGNQLPDRKEFDIGFLPIFDKDLTDIAKLIDVYRANGIISKKSSREIVGLDSSDEDEFIEQEVKKEQELAPPEPIMVGPDGKQIKKPAAQQPKPKPKPKAKRPNEELND